MIASVQTPHTRSVRVRHETLGTPSDVPVPRKTIRESGRESGIEEGYRPNVNLLPGIWTPCESKLPAHSGHPYTSGMRSQVKELLEGARQGRWILPSSDEPNPVSLARAIASVNGAPTMIADPVADRLRELIGEPEHLVFVIADGSGMNFVNTFDENSFSRSHLVLENRAVFPTSTGSNLFAFGRAQWPGQHGELGWYVHLPELGERATLLSWVRTRDGTSLSTLGLSGETVFPGDPMQSRYQRDSLAFLPDFIARSMATKALVGDQTVGYEELADAVDLAAERIKNVKQPTYTTSSGRKSIRPPMAAARRTAQHWHRCNFSIRKCNDWPKVFQAALASF